MATSAQSVLKWLARTGTKKVRDGMARYAIPSEHAFGVSVGDLRKEAKRIGRDHDLAHDLWATGKYEARMLAIFVADPALVTPSHMDHWCRDFDSWALCDTACFHLFDRTPHAYRKVTIWAKRRGEFQKRAAFALLASLATHDKAADDPQFSDLLPLIEAHATDERNFVKKAVNWALRGVGERSTALHRQAVRIASRLARSDDATARWIGRDAKKQLERPAVQARLARRK
ncbi:MAG: DNA alkylation repair protein [bacterium]|nr:DNA alkylation repair protein [bacterium]